VEDVPQKELAKKARRKWPKKKKTVAPPHHSRSLKKRNRYRKAILLAACAENYQEEWKRSIKDAYSTDIGDLTKRGEKEASHVDSCPREVKSEEKG